MGENDNTGNSNQDNDGSLGIPKKLAHNAYRNR
jgi:hypothetical protein